MTRSGVLLFSIGVAALWGSGCDVHTHLKPVPVIYGPGRLDLCSIIPEGHRTSSVPVFYATNRKPHRDPDRAYGNDVDSSLHLGVATIRLGDGKQKQATWDEICRASTGQGGDPIFSLSGSREFPDSKALCDAINEQLASTPNHEVNIYVHGFFTKFDVAVELLAKMQHCSGRRGVMLCFSWPARQNVFDYGGDVKRGRASAHYLADLIELIAANTKAKNINVLAYSAGAACATDALLERRNRHRDQTPEQLAKSLRIGNIIYAASDLDTATFAREQIVQLKQLARDIVIYVSKNDSMLRLASLTYGASLSGCSGPPDSGRRCERRARPAGFRRFRRTLLLVLQPLGHDRRACRLPLANQPRPARSVPPARHVALALSKGLRPTGHRRRTAPRAPDHRAGDSMRHMRQRRRPGGGRIDSERSCAGHSHWTLVQSVRDRA
jgi:esterase/lipase superfamily enzyme